MAPTESLPQPYPGEHYFELHFIRNSWNIWRLKYTSPPAHGQYIWEPHPLGQGGLIARTAQVLVIGRATFMGPQHQFNVTERQLSRSFLHLYNRAKDRLQQTRTIEGSERVTDITRDKGQLVVDIHRHTRRKRHILTDGMEQAQDQKMTEPDITQPTQ